MQAGRTKIALERFPTAEDHIEEVTTEKINIYVG